MARSPDVNQVVAYRQSAEDVVAALGSDAQRGLDAQEARARLERYRPNELTASKVTPAWRRFAAQFQDTLVILLLIATAVSVGLWVYERDEALPYEGSASSRSCCSTASWAMCWRHVPIEPWQRCGRCRRPGDRHSRRRAPKHPGDGDRAGRHDSDRGGRHDPGRRALGPVDRAPDGRGVADG